MQGLKATLLRWYYRLVNWWAWRRHSFAVSSEELTVDGADGPLPARLYRPDSSEPQGLILYFHGGGWVIGDLRTHDPFCRQLCQQSGCAVLAVDYRLAPAHRYPAAAEDCIAATRWVHAHRGELAPAGIPLFVAGDSAGGNLAAVVATRAGESYAGHIAGQVLIYPVTRYYNPPTSSCIENGKGYGLTRDLMEWFWDTYLGEKLPADEDNTLSLAVLLAQTPPPGTPPALVITAGLDPLRDEGADYARELAATGINCVHELFMDEMHGFVCSDGPTPGHRGAMTLVSAWITQHST